ncbi:hypothetical protein OH76DRAFT_1424156 [Lentinus brumalis]|uniref:Uncharacterized protein n=1 Tax=Lentinus brumalis TaxID=2498619 RepID=A0A371CHC1_9APHY|nr:hypothetical protein OH76DRAFT_1424156 [Polyporus brumalis]
MSVLLSNQCPASQIYRESGSLTHLKPNYNRTPGAWSAVVRSKEQGKDQYRHTLQDIGGTRLHTGGMTAGVHTRQQRAPLPLPGTGDHPAPAMLPLSDVVPPPGQPPMKETMSEKGGEAETRWRRR